MTLITLLSGFKVPIAVLDRFLAARGVEETWHVPPPLFRRRGASTPANPDPASREAVRLFVPRRRGHGAHRGARVFVSDDL